MLLSPPTASIGAQDGDARWHTVMRERDMAAAAQLIPTITWAGDGKPPSWLFAYDHPEMVELLLPHWIDSLGTATRADVAWLEIASRGHRATFERLLALGHDETGPAWCRLLCAALTQRGYIFAAAMAAMDTDRANIIDVLLDLLGQKLEGHVLRSLTKFACRAGAVACFVKLRDLAASKGMLQPLLRNGDPPKRTITPLMIAEWAVTPKRDSRGERTSRDHDAFLARVFGSVILGSEQMEHNLAFFAHLLRLALASDTTSALWLCRRWPLHAARSPWLVSELVRLACRRADSWCRNKVSNAHTLERLVEVLDLVGLPLNASTDVFAVLEAEATKAHRKRKPLASLYYYHLYAYGCARMTGDEPISEWLNTVVQGGGTQCRADGRAWARHCSRPSSGMVARVATVVRKSHASPKISTSLLAHVLLHGPSDDAVAALFAKHRARAMTADSRSLALPEPGGPNAE